MADNEVLVVTHPDQQRLLTLVSEKDLVVVEYIGISAGSSVKCRPAPSPSGELFNVARLPHYGVHCRGDKLYILKDDVDPRYYRISEAKLSIPREVKSARTAIKRKNSGAVGNVEIVR